ncbi:MAG: hypothetical protein II168_06105, partial [Ruminococcus sp.]|nr:hypothetical protein [Ruminococcus sp.]
MKKRALAVVLSVFMAACMTACGDSASTADTEKTESSSSQAQSESVADSESKTESGADSESKPDSKGEASSDSDSSNAEEKQEEKEVLIKKETYMGNDLSERCTYSYEYDKSTGHYIRTEQKESSSIQKPGTMETSYISKNEYDKDMTLIATYNEAGQLTLKNELNENGKVSKSTRYTKTGAVQGYHLYEYD